MLYAWLFPTKRIPSKHFFFTLSLSLSSIFLHNLYHFHGKKNKKQIYIKGISLQRIDIPNICSVYRVQHNILNYNNKINNFSSLGHVNAY